MAIGLSFGLCVGLCLAAQPGAAEVRSDFTFKRIGAPGTGTAGKRITVQIELGAPQFPDAPNQPVYDDPAAAREAGAGGAPGASSAFEWYWAAVSPDLAQAGMARFLDAVEALDKVPADQTLYSPRLSTLQGIAESHGSTILEATIGTRVSPALVLAVIAVESGGRTDAVSKAGANGLMQLMPATASRFGVTDSADARQNIKGGVAYLDWLMGEFGGDAVLALAGYNAGEGAVKRNFGVPPFAETRGYVPKVLSAWKVARGLCLTPPELPGDGCVFAVRTASKN